MLSVLKKQGVRTSRDRNKHLGALSPGVQGNGSSQRRRGLSFEEGGPLKGWDGELVVEGHRCPS